MFRCATAASAKLREKIAGGLSHCWCFSGSPTFIVYSTWAALQGDHYSYGPYLSPFYSPLLMTDKPGWWPAFVPFSAAMLILWAPGGFRLTCYYYRGAYYKAFWADPPIVHGGRAS